MAMVSRQGRPDEDAATGPVAGRATIRRSTVLLGGVEAVVTESRDELAVTDIIDTDGGEDFSAFATSR